MFRNVDSRFRRKSKSPEVIRIRDTNQEISGRKIPSLTEINLRPELNSSRFSLDSNGGSNLSTFRSGLSSSVSSPNLVDSQHKRPKAELDLGSDLCPICSMPFDEQPESRVPRILPCLHTVCTGPNVIKFLRPLFINGHN
jgi:hypothetical protein